MTEVLLKNNDEQLKKERRISEGKGPASQNTVTGPQLLPAQYQENYSSIIACTFQSDIQLVYPKNQNLERQKLRFQLIQYSLNLGAYQHVLFSAFFYLQKFLNKKGPEVKHSSSLPIACLSLARKYQKGKSPSLDVWGQKLKKQIIKEQIQTLQDQIIQTLQFELEPVTRLNFMTDLYLTVSLDPKIQNFCSYLLELSLYTTHMQPKPDKQSLDFSEGQIALSVIRLACHFLNPEQMPKLPISQLGYSCQRVHDCCSVMFELLLNRKMSECRHIRTKYKKPKFMEVAKIQFFKIDQNKIQQDRNTADEEQQSKKSS